MRNVGKEFFAGKKIRVFNADRRVSYILDLPKESVMGLRDLIEIADTNVHENFGGIVKNFSLSVCSYEDIRNAEQNKEIPFVLTRSKTQTNMKFMGQTLFTV